MCQRRPCGPLQGRRCPRNVGLLAGSLGQIRRRLSSGNLDLRQGHHGIRSLAVDGEVWVPAADSLGITDLPNPFFGQLRAAPVNEPRTLRKYKVIPPLSNHRDTIKPSSFPWFWLPWICVHLSIYLFIYLSIYLSIYSSIYLSVYLFIYLSLILDTYEIIKNCYERGFPANR